jgi:tetratricopeptide (TPR) repeat protein
MAAEAAKGLDALKPPQSGANSLIARGGGKNPRQSDAQKFYRGRSRLRAIAELLARKHEWKLAREYFAREAALEAKIPADTTILSTAEQPRQVEPLIRIADMFAEAGEWRNAATAYHRAWEISQTNSVPLYLEGRALVEAGDKQAGQKLIDRAAMLPLSQGEPRQRLAEALQQRGLEHEAREQWELILRIGSENLQRGQNDWAVQEAARVVGNAVEKSDPARAAMLWQRLLVRPGGSRGAGSYVDIANQIHKCRAIGLLDQGHIARAFPEIELARAARPGDTELAVLVWPKLVNHKQQAEAETLFAAVYNAIDQVCQVFPNSSQHHHDLAALSVGCNHRLNDGLAHAAAAVRLAPENMTYLSTLAGIHDRSGDRAAAIELVRKALEREPGNVQLKELLQTFE